MLSTDRPDHGLTPAEAVLLDLSDEWLANSWVWAPYNGKLSHAQLRVAMVLRDTFVSLRNSRIMRYYRKLV